MFPVPEGFAGFTAPELRGTGLATAALRGLWREHRPPGPGRNTALVLRENRAGTRVLEKKGYEPVAVVHSFGVGRRRRIVRR